MILIKILSQGSYWPGGTEADCQRGCQSRHAADQLQLLHHSQRRAASAWVLRRGETASSPGAGAA
jgi:hypothetical protein